MVNIRKRGKVYQYQFEIANYLSSSIVIITNYCQIKLAL